MSLSDDQIIHYFNHDAIQRRREYDANGMLVYLGFAQAGALTSENVWVIYKYTNNDLGSPTFDRPLANVAWDNRASLPWP